MAPLAQAHEEPDVGEAFDEEQAPHPYRTPSGFPTTKVECTIRPSPAQIVKAIPVGRDTRAGFRCARHAIAVIRVSSDCVCERRLTPLSRAARPLPRTRHPAPAGGHPSGTGRPPPGRPLASAGGASDRTRSP